MSDEYMIKVGLQLDRSQAQRMENDLNGRFKKVATKFSSRLGSGLKRLAYSGILASAVGALLQPLDRLNDKIDNTLNKFSDIRAQAMGFGVDEAEYLKARILSESVGVQNFDALFAKFKKEMINVNKGLPSALAQFKGQSGDVTDFMQLISSLKMADPSKRQLMVGQIFGEDQITEVNKLIVADLTRLANQLNKGTENSDISVGLQRISNLKQEQTLLAGKRSIDELIQAPTAITSGVLGEQDAYFRRQNEQLNAQLRQYSNVATIQKGVDTLVSSTNKMASSVGGIYNYMRDYVRLEKGLRVQRTQGKITAEEYDRQLDNFINERGVFK